jgi:SAM-dependent methyltransferase
MATKIAHKEKNQYHNPIISNRGEKQMNKQLNHTTAEKKVDAFVGQVVNDIAAAYSGVLTKIGHSLGLYKALAQNGELSAAELAEKTGTSRRYVLEWLNNQAAGGYIDYNPAQGRYKLPAEHAPVLADEDSPVFLAGSLGSLTAIYKIEEKLTKAFKTGGGIGWHEQDESLFFGTEFLFRTGYKAHLTSEWIPALSGVDEKLKTGGTVADIGCGHGASSIIMAQNYPKASFVGFDYHKGSIDVARRRAKEAGVENRVRFEVATAKDYPGSNYDLICFMDCLHDLGDPLGAAGHSFKALAEGGSVLLVEPNSGDRIEQNLHPIGRLFYAASTAFCTPNSLSQEVGSAIGAQAGEARYADIMFQAGFRKFKRATETPFNLIFEARK